MGDSQVVLVVKNPPANAWDMRDMDSVSGLWRSPEGGPWQPTPAACLENPMDRGAWWATLSSAAESDMSDWARAHTHTHTHTPVE